MASWLLDSPTVYAQFSSLAPRIGLGGRPPLKTKKSTLRLPSLPISDYNKAFINFQGAVAPDRSVMRSLIQALTVFSSLVVTTTVAAQSFNETSVKGVVISKENKGGQAQAYVVADAGANAMVTAKACVEHYLKRYKSAFCMVFPDEASFKVAEVDLEKGGMNKLCWTANYGKAIAGNVNESTQTVEDNVASWGCPKASKAKAEASGGAPKSDFVVAKEIIKGLEEVVKRGSEMQPLRNSSKATQCGVAMRANQAFAKEVRAKTEGLKGFHKVKVAANTYPEICVSCKDKALADCNDLKKAIDEAKPVKESDGKTGW